MSEYQHYEFLALDRSLSSDELERLRAVSSRAEISPSRFSVVYNWGNFRGSPLDFMEKYFDAHVYVSSFGTSTLMLGFPDTVLARKEVEAFIGAGFECRMTKKRCILTWNREDEDHEWIDDEGWIARLVPLREEIECGDHRPLYLGWLRGVTVGECEEDDMEPPVPPGLSDLTPAQNALVEFLQVDVDLLEAAALTSVKPEKTEVVEARMAAWIATRSVEEARQYLLLLLRGRGKEAERQLRLSFSEAHRPASPTLAAGSRRTVGELEELAEAAAARRLEREEAARLKQLKEERQQREKYLAGMVVAFASHWQRADKLAEKGTASGYQEATALLVDLAEAATLAKRKGEFSNRLAQFRQTHARRGALLRRLDEKKLR